MLSKLLKYNLKDMFRFLTIFYILSFFFAICARIFLNIENSVLFNIIGQIFSGATISMFFNIFINNLMRFWVRFRQNLYGDEAYLTHTLPVKKSSLYSSKIISTIITLFASFVVITLSLFVAYYSKENLEILKSMILPLTSFVDMKIIPIIIAFIFILFLEFLNILQCGFTGIILGHRMNNGKIGFSVLFGFISYTLSQLIVLFVLFIFALLNNDFMNLFVTESVLSPQTLKLLIIFAIIIYTVISVLIYFVNVKLFNKGVNVD